MNINLRCSAHTSFRHHDIIVPACIFTRRITLPDVFLTTTFESYSFSRQENVLFSEERGPHQLLQHEVEDLLEMVIHFTSDNSTYA